MKLTCHFWNFILLSAWLTSMTSLHAQPFSGGFFAGLTASQVDGDNYSGFDKAGLTAGGYVSRSINPSVQWKAELRYAQKGAYHKPDDSNPELYRLSLHFAEIPLLGLFRAYERTWLEAGLSPEVYLFHKEENEFGDLRAEDYPAFHRFGLSANAGIVFDAGMHLRAGIRYNYSIIPIREHASGQTYLLNRGQYSNSLGFTLYYHFD